MMLIGTSFGGCLKSILSGEVSEDDVLLIIARTRADDLEAVVQLAERYYLEGNKTATVSQNYEFSKSIALEDVKALAARLYLGGKIHQPRIYDSYNDGFIHQDMNRSALWMEVNPIGLNDNPSVIDAYQKYRVLDSLTK